MGLFSNIRTNYNAYQFGKAFVNEGGFKAPGGGKGNNMLSALANMLQPKFAEPPARETKDWLQLLTSSPRMDPIHKIAQDVASAEWSLQLDKGEETEEILEHELIDLFNRPNPLPETTWYSLLYMTEAYLQTSGEAFWLLERNGLNSIAEIWIVPSHWVTQTPNANANFYEVATADGAMLKIDVDDMVYFKEPNLLNPYGRGKGKVSAIEDEVATDEYMARWSKKFFFNDATPPWVMIAPGAGKNDAERIQESWMQRYAGLKNAHKPAVLPFNGDIKTLSDSVREMDFIESRKYLRDQAIQHFRIPPELMGIIENSNRATIEAADYIYKDSVLKPRLEMISRNIQIQIIDKFYEGSGMLFVYDNVVPADKQFELTASNEGLSRGAISINEWRQKNGYDMLDGDDGDVFLIPNTHTAVHKPIEARMFANPTATPMDKPKPDEEVASNGKVVNIVAQKGRSYGDADIISKFAVPTWKAGLTKSERDNVALVLNGRLDELLAEDAKAIEKFLRDQGRRFAKHVETNHTKLIGIELVETKSDDFDADGALEDIDALMDGYDWIDEQNQLHELLGPQMLASAQAGSEIVAGLFTLGISFDLIRPEMLELLEAIGLEKVVGIQNTTMLGLRKTLLEGMRKGEGGAKLAKRIREYSQEYSYRRSFVIARTEAHNSMVAGTKATYEKAEVPSKEWLTVMDGRERDSHHDINGEVVSMDAKFSNGLDHPGDPGGAAEEVIQCRCQLIPSWIKQ